MERYTYQDGGKWRMRIGDTEYSGKAVDRLAAYEDTGLEPGEVNAVAGLASENCAKAADKIDQLLSDDKELEEYRALGPIDRLRELAQAHLEGRCVVLPVGGYTDKDGENALKSAMNTCFYHNNPVTRYIADAVAEKLTREEADAALRREQE